MGIPMIPMHAFFPQMRANRPHSMATPKWMKVKLNFATKAIPTVFFFCFAISLINQTIDFCHMKTSLPLDIAIGKENGWLYLNVAQAYWWLTTAVFCFVFFFAFLLVFHEKLVYFSFPLPLSFGQARFFSVCKRRKNSLIQKDSLSGAQGQRWSKSNIVKYVLTVANRKKNRI